MAKLTVEHQEEILTFPPDTILDLKIEECNIREYTGDRGSWSKLEFKFKILGIQALGDGSQDFAPYENWITRFIYGSVPARLTDSPENRLRIWAEAVFQMELGLGFELDTDQFIGRRVRGLTSQYDTKGRDAKGNPLKRHQIETLLPASGQQSASSAPPAAQGSWVQSAGQTTAAAATANPWGDAWSTGDEPPF